MVFTVQFSVTVSGVGGVVVNLPNITANSCEEAIALARSTLIQVICTGALKTA